MATPFVSGYSKLTTSGAVGDSGKAQWISGYAVQSAATAAQPYFRNGTGAATDTTVFQAAGSTANAWSNQSVGQLPLVFPGGCYISFDANTTAVTVYYVQALT